MKHLKTKFGLSVLALACLGAGVISLQPTVTADAEATPNADGLRMAQGASVCLNEGFSGIRWATTVEKTWYNETCTGKTCKFGVVVAPTSSLTETELTVETEDVVVLPTTIDASEGDVTYYSVIDYNDIVKNYEGNLEDEEVLETAYTMELTARAYVEIDGTYYYADLSGMNTSRSARQVAIAAELAGEIDEKYRNSEDDNKKALANNAEAYYGMADAYVPQAKSIGAAGTPYIDKENLPTEEKPFTVKIDLDTDDTPKEVLIGGEKITASYADKTLTITEAEYIPEGEYYITVFGQSGKIYTTPIIGATKVLTKAEDLKMFNAKGDKGVYTTKTVDSNREEGVNFVEKYWKPEQEQGGYYVLGQNIEANGYVHGSKNVEDKDKEIVADSYNNATWNAITSYKNKPIGLTGTFNGMGYTIKDMTIGTEREGFFGVVNGGTVKNVAFTNVKSGRLVNDGYGYRYVIANYLIDATIDNVFIETNAYDSSDATNNPGFDVANSALLADVAIGDTKISNCYFKLNKVDSENDNIRNLKGGALFANSRSDESFTFDNVAVWHKEDTTIQKIYVLAETTSEDVTTYSRSAVTVPISAVLGEVPTFAQNEDKTYTGEVTKGVIYLYANYNDSDNYTFNVEDDYADARIAKTYDFKKLKGVSRYTTGTELKRGFTAGYNNLAGFEASGCWDTSAGYATWKNV